MAEIPAVARRARRIGVLLCLSALSGCGDGPTLPVPDQPGFVLKVSIPGLTDTTIQGDSVYWRFEYGHGPIGGPERKDVALELLVLDPPPPLLSPLTFELRWYELQTDLPEQRRYGLDPVNHPDGVLFQAISNLGIWLSSRGQLRLDAVTDSSITGTLSAKLAPYPRGNDLPDVTVNATFWAPRTTDF